MAKKLRRVAEPSSPPGIRRGGVVAAAPARGDCIFAAIHRSFAATAPAVTATFTGFHAADPGSFPVSADPDCTSWTVPVIREVPMDLPVSRYYSRDDVELESATQPDDWRDASIEGVYTCTDCGYKTALIMLLQSFQDLEPYETEKEHGAEEHNEENCNNQPTIVINQGDTAAQ